MGSAPRKQSKTYKVPKRPYEAARLDAELKVGLEHLFTHSATSCARGLEDGDAGYGRKLEEDVEMFSKNCWND